jgi:adenine-specific DNA-methyltransferase
MTFPTQYNKSNKCILHLGDSLNFLKKIPDKSIALVVTSPPYCMGREYDKSSKLDYFLKMHKKLFPEIIRVLKDNGSFCWQVGYHVNKKNVVPLDYLIFDVLKGYKDIFLKNRIIWHYGHGLHGTKRLSGRHEIILWFTKNPDNYTFNLDSIRIPQKYPGKKHYKGEKRGTYSGNPSGKNPSDVWEIPNVKANHIEKTCHPCQFPVALVQRLILALTNKGEYVLDPFMGVGSSGVASLIEGRKFIGVDTNKKYWKEANKRCNDALNGKVKIRPHDKPIFIPTQNMAVAQKPDFFK